MAGESCSSTHATQWRGGMGYGPRPHACGFVTVAFTASSLEETHPIGSLPHQCSGGLWSVHALCTPYRLDW